MNDHQLKRRGEPENRWPLLTLGSTRTQKAHACKERRRHLPAAIKHIFLPQRETSQKGNSDQGC